MLPIIFNVAGGIIAFFVIKEDDPKKAKNCLYLGLILAAIPILLIIVPILIGITLLPHMVRHHHRLIRITCDDTMESM